MSFPFSSIAASFTAPAITIDEESDPSGEIIGIRISNSCPTEAKVQEKTTGLGAPF